MNREIGPWAKSFPRSSWGLDAADFVASGPRLQDFLTPLISLDATAMSNNVALMSEWVQSRGLNLAPHGKTTMAPQLWRQLLAAGAWGITLATPWQVQFARTVGIDRLLVANEFLDPHALEWLGVELADPSFEFTCWVDSLDAVEAMRSGLRGAARPVDVLVELGAVGGRTGARGQADALRVASAVDSAPELRLVGIGGYEGALASSRTATGIGSVERYLAELVELHDHIDWHSKPIVTAGGSAWFDLVADQLSGLADRATVVLRSGAFQIHDDGAYRAISPLGGLRSAMHGWARVLSHPEPNLGILDGGKRDFPYDEGLPVSPLGEVTKMNDQHSYFRSTSVSVGQIVKLGLSHPCTAFDKWRLLPVVEDANVTNPSVIDVVATYF